MNKLKRKKPLECTIASPRTRIGDSKKHRPMAQADKMKPANATAGPSTITTLKKAKPITAQVALKIF